MPDIHPTAIIDNGAIIGQGSKIWHFCHVMNGAVIGAGCTIGQGCFIAPAVFIGNRVKIQNGVSVFTGVHIEDDAFVGPCVTFTNVLNPRAFMDKKQEFRHTVIKRGATIGANATLVCGVTIGKYAMIGAGAVVIRDVPDFALMVGNPARQIGWVDKEGHSRKDMPNGQML